MILRTGKCRSKFKCEVERNRASKSEGFMNCSEVIQYAYTSVRAPIYRTYHDFINELTLS